MSTEQADQEIRATGMRADLRRRQALLNLDELRVVDRVVDRLALGRDRYGPLDLSKPRDWRRELREELLDALVYDVAEEIAAEDAAHADLQEAARREIAEWRDQQLTEISTEPARIAFEDLDDHARYAAFDVSDVEGG